MPGWIRECCMVILIFFYMDWIIAEVVHMYILFLADKKEIVKSEK